MNASQIYMIISATALVIVVLLAFFVARSKKEKAITQLTLLALGFILTGTLYSSERLLSYGLIGIGVTLSIVDMVRNLREKKQNEMEN